MANHRLDFIRFANTPGQPSASINDNFEDGDYTNNPTWTEYCGTSSDWQVVTDTQLDGSSGNVLESTSGEFSLLIVNTDYQDGDIYADVREVNTGNFSGGGIVYRFDPSTTEGYFFRYESNGDTVGWGRIDGTCAHNRIRKNVSISNTEYTWGQLRIEFSGNSHVGYFRQSSSDSWTEVINETDSTYNSSSHVQSGASCSDVSQWDNFVDNS